MKRIVCGETRPVERYVIVPLCILIIALILTGVLT